MCIQVWDNQTELKYEFTPENGLVQSTDCKAKISL